MSIVDDVSQCLTQLSEEQIELVTAAVDERQFNRDRSPLDFDTAVERLRSCRDIVLGTIENGLFATLSQSIQGEVSSVANSLAQNLSNIVAGTDDLDALSLNVDQLHTYVWRNRLAEKSTKVVNLTEKLDQLTKLTGGAQRLNADCQALVARGAEIETLVEQSRQAVNDVLQAQSEAQTACHQTSQHAQETQTTLATLNQSRDQVNDLFSQAQSSIREMNSIVENLRTLDEQSRQSSEQTAKHAEDAQAALAGANERNAQVDALLAQAQASVQEMNTLGESLRKLDEEAQSFHQQTAQQAQETQNALTAANERNTQVNDLLAQARSSMQEITTFETDLKKLYEEAQAFREKIATTEQAAQGTVDQNNSRTKEIQDGLVTLETQIRDALQKATGASLFHSFQHRREQIGKGKWIWAIMAAVFGIGTVIWVSVIAYTCTAIAPALYFKLAVALPITLIVWFCIAQYNRERRLEEEYAFKSNISLSLVPYRDLVEEVLSKQGEAARDKYAEFVIDSVGKVFTAPTDHKGDMGMPDLKRMSTEQLKLLAELVSIALGKGK